MYIISVIPATKIPLPAPQTLTYFTAHELTMGSLVLAPFYKRNIIGVVESIEKLNGQKMRLRQADFVLKKILEIISNEPIVDEKQMKLVKWISEYYWTPLGTAIKMALPKAMSFREALRLRSAQAKATGNFATSQRGRVLQIHDDKISQTLILVPEISAIQGALKQYKDLDAAILHSGLTAKQYLENWQKIRKGEAKIIIGTRTALFAPFVNLKKIFVKNEHNQSYKSQRAPRLHARETALKLAELWNAEIILESSTPSIEAFYLSTRKTISLKIQKPDNQQPDIQIVDMRQELKEGNVSIFSRELQNKLNKIISTKQRVPHNNCAGQAILFVGRRGASTFVLCRDCGYVIRCPNCEAPMVYHLSPLVFICHHCGHQEKPPALCPKCQGARIKFFGTGTQKVETELKKLIPQAKASRLDSDTTKTPQTKMKIIDSFQNQKINILIGAQMIIGENLNKAQLVAAISADVLLNLPDFRSNERVFQTLCRLKNLAQDNLIIQTYAPENNAIKMAAQNNYQTFYHNEIQNRKALAYPPFSQLIKLVYKHKSAEKAEQEAKILAEKLKQQLSPTVNHQQTTNSRLNLKTNRPITILGPSPAFISKVKGKFIWQMVLKSNIANLETRNKILKIIPPNWTVDVDPVRS